MQIIKVFFISILVAACNAPPKITLTSTPSGANVLEAGKGDIGVTPVVFNMTREDCENKNGHCYASFYFSKPGYKSQREERVVDSVFSGKGLLVHAYLKENKTQLIVRGFPAFAEFKVSFRGADNTWHELALTGQNGMVPSLLDDQPWQGKDYCLLKLNFESPGYIPVEKNITIKRYEQKIVEYVLQEYALSGGISSQPLGVDVYERSLGYLGRTPFQIKITYDQLVRISPQRRINLHEPIFLFLKFSKEGYEDLHQITSIGEIDEIEEPVDFSISGNLNMMNRKK